MLLVKDSPCVSMDLAIEFCSYCTGMFALHCECLNPSAMYVLRNSISLLPQEAKNRSGKFEDGIDVSESSPEFHVETH